MREQFDLKSTAQELLKRWGQVPLLVFAGHTAPGFPCFLYATTSFWETGINDLKWFKIQILIVLSTWFNGFCTGILFYSWSYS